MDTIAAYRAFLHVSERGSFTLGAAAARIPQPVASRRVAALEKQLGEKLLDRSGQRVTLTAFGRAMVPSAERLVRLVDAMEYEAEMARLGPVRLAVPDVCSVRNLAVLVAEAAVAGVNLELQTAPPAVRTELARLHQVEAAIVVTAGTAGTAGSWTIPLGLAGREVAKSTLYVETLRPGRAQRPVDRVRMWVQPEDDVPYIADYLKRLSDATGLSPSQVAVATSLASGAGHVLGSADLLLCSPQQADELNLHWRPLGEITLTRHYTVVGADDLVQLILTSLKPALSRCLGAPTGAA